jgi:signal transduction histidine kinase/ActR/RegA family two-component response regulator
VAHTSGFSFHDNSPEFSLSGESWSFLAFSRVFQKRFPEILLLALLYYLTARLGQVFAIPPGNVTPIWIPSGICLAAILIRGYGIWPAIFLGAFAGNVWAYLDLESSGNILRSLLTGTSNGVGDVLCACGAAYYIHRLTGERYPFKKAAHVAVFVIFGAVLGPLVSALFGVTSLCINGFMAWSGYLPALFTWWTGDAVGVLVITPLLTSLAFHDDLIKSDSRRQAAIFLAGLLLVSALSLGILPPIAGHVLPIVTLGPLLIWSSFRFNQRVVFFSVLVVAGLTIVANFREQGPFVGHDLGITLMEMQWFLAIMSVTVLSVSSVVHERTVIRRQLQQAHDQLESRVQKRTSELRESYLKLEGEMHQRLAAEKEKNFLEGKLRLAQKLEAIGTLAGGIAHDFNNILMAMMGHTDLALLDAPPGSDQAQSLKEIQRSQLRARDLIKRILLYARPGEARTEMVDLEELISETLAILRGSMPSTIEIQVKLAQGVVVLADPSQIMQAIVNLCTNSYRAMAENGGKLIIELGLQEFSESFTGCSLTVPPGQYARITIADTGKGMSPEVMERAFDPFFTTMPSGKGTGMGLAVVICVIQAAKGTITLESSLGQGTRFDIFLPLSSEVAAEAPPENSSLPQGSERVLFIDDEPVLVELAIQTLNRLGYKVTGFTDSIQALEHFGQDPEGFDLIITDLTMPKLPGDKLTLAIKKIRRDIPILLCSGYSDRMGTEATASLELAGTMSKPLTTNELADKVRLVLDQGGSGKKDCPAEPS